MFRPGPLSVDDARELNRALESVRRFENLSVGGPLEMRGNVLSAKKDPIEIVQKLSDSYDGNGHYPGRLYRYDTRTNTYFFPIDVKILNLNRGSYSIPNQKYLGKYVGISTYGPPVYAVYCCSTPDEESSGSSLSHSLSSNSSSSSSSSSSGVGGDYSISTACCPNLLPSTVTVTISNKTGTCGCLPSYFQLRYDSFSHNWTAPTGTVTLCGNVQPVSFGCLGGGVSFSLSGAPSPACQFTASTGSWTCDPLMVVFSNVPISGGSCCTGTATFIVTQ